MTYKLARKLIDARRERVAALRLRGFTEREIVAALEQQGFFNPETHRPYSTGCIAKDILALQKQWRENAARAISEHKSEQLAEIAEVKRSAWAAKKLDTVLKGLEREAKILGTDAPTRIDFHDLDAAIDRELESLAAAGQGAVSGAPAGDPDAGPDL
jgi:transposase